MTPILFVPGLMCDGRLFGPQLEAFGRGREVAIADITGADTVADLADAALAQAGWDRFALAGLSMGGIVAMAMIDRAPHRIDRLALMDTNPRAELPDVAANREPQIAKAWAGKLDTVMREELKPNYLAPGPGRQAIMDICMAMALDLGPAVFERQSRALQSRPDQREALTRISVPSLALCGEGDKLCPVERHEEIASLIPGCELAVIAGAGHMPTLERPDETNAVLRQWLAD